jgi:hypothetical protein
MAKLKGTLLVLIIGILWLQPQTPKVSLTDPSTQQFVNPCLFHR